MRKYCFLQAKRLIRVLPGVILAALILLGSLLAVFTMVIRQDSESEKNQKFQVGLTGETDNSFLQMGLAAIATMDATRFTVEIHQMTPTQAAAALAAGELAAYIEIPEGFMEEALRGDIMQLKFVTTLNGTGLAAVLKDGITHVISQILISAQQGVFGMAGAAHANGQVLDGHLDEMSIEYISYMFARNQMYRLTEVGVGDSLSLENYLLCGLSVLLLYLCCLPFAPLMIRRDHALDQMLAARGTSPWIQAAGDFLLYALGLLAAVTVLLGTASVAARGQILFGKVLWSAVPAVVSASAVTFMLYCLASDLVGGVLLQFFTTLLLCLASGCLYPAYFFPASLQKMAAWLPTGLARMSLAGYFTGGGPMAALCLMGSSVIFFGIGAAVRVHRIRGVES